MTMVPTAYAAYVWAAYAISLAVLFATVAVTWARWHVAKKRLAALKDSETKI